MDFNLSEYGSAFQQAIGKPLVEKVEFDNEEMKAYVFPNKKLMSPGVWNRMYYSPEELRAAYGQTDWNDARNVALFADHEDVKTSSWVGYVRNPRMDGDHLLGDLVVVDKEFAQKLAFGAKFGISPKIQGKNLDGAVVGSSYMNFSFVTDPACKTTWLNKQEEKKDEEEKEEDKKKELGCGPKEKLEEEDESNPQDKKKKPEVTTMADEKEQPIEEAAETKVDDVGKTLADSITTGMKEISEGMKAGFDGISSKLDSLKAEEPAEEPAEKEPAPEADEPPAEKLEQESETIQMEQITDEPAPVAVKGTEAGSAVKEYKNADEGMLAYLQHLGGTSDEFDLSMEIDNEDRSPYMSFTLSSTATAVASTQGSAITSPYRLNPILWAKTLVDGGKNLMFFKNAVREAAVPKGHKTLIMPRRNKYEDTWEASAEEYNVATDILATEINDMEGVEFTPTRYNYRIAITNKNININAVDLMRYGREELAYKWANDVDAAIATGLVGASAADNDTPGAMDLYGGDATSLATLEAGDTLDTDMIAEGIKLLKSKWNYYWTGGELTKDDTYKNPWQNDSSGAFMLFMAPEQTEDLTTDSQFVNASEYGTNEVVLKGEIGQYLGVKIIESNNTPAYANFGNGEDIDGHKLLLVKSQYCGGLAWGQKPSIKAFDWPIQDQKQVVLNLEYDTEPIQADAIVRLNVTDN